ncbi:MAG: AMP-binding protein [Oligoflexia bacterium]|nr:AMP-binding protein [Oligoflexia bacterium]
MRIDWRGDSTETLLNPRLAAQEAVALREELRVLPELRGHFWIGTSGSTGTMKWVALSKTAVLAAAEGANRHLESGSKDVWLKALPSFHVGGLAILARAELSGARVVDLSERASKWEPRVFHDECQREQVTLASLVPAQLYDLIQGDLRAPRSLRATVIGGGALEPSLYLAARGLGWKPLPSYGLTECGSQVATATLGSLEGEGFPELCLLPHVEARAEAQGLLELRSAALLTGYGIQGRFVEPKRNGWFTTEDVGSVEGRFLRVQGRRSAFVKIGGESVDLARLERLFEEARLELRSTLDAAVVAIPDARLGHHVELAFARGGADGGDSEAIAQAAAEALRGRYDSKVQPFERIRALRPVARIPRSALGKLLRAELSAVLGREA